MVWMSPKTVSDGAKSLSFGDGQTQKSLRIQF